MLQGATLSVPTVASTRLEAWVVRDGTEVAVKVQRPGIVDQLHSDLEALDSVAARIDKATDIGRRVLERLQQLSRSDAVVHIFTDPCLKKAGNEAAYSAPAIDEVLLHAADLGHMEMRLDRFAIGPDDGQRERRCGSERGLQSRDGNARFNRTRCGATAGGGIVGCVHI